MSAGHLVTVTIIFGLLWFILFIRVEGYRRDLEDIRRDIDAEQDTRHYAFEAERQVRKSQLTQVRKRVARLEKSKDIAPKDTQP